MMAQHIDPFAGICIHGIKGAHINNEGSPVSPDCHICFPDRRSRKLDVLTMTREMPRDEDRKRSCGRLICPPTNDCTICL